MLLLLSTSSGKQSCSNFRLPRIWSDGGDRSIHCVHCARTPAKPTSTFYQTGSSTALDRYKKRHDAILRILVEWITNHNKPDCEIFVDLQVEQFKPLSNIFQTLRPDIAILNARGIVTLELTICHETNLAILAKSKDYKSSKYADILSDTNIAYSESNIQNYTIEITTLGLISDCSEFCKNNLVSLFPDEILSQLSISAISNTFEIYCNQNNLDT